jgi:hypothetical protein
MGDDYVVIEPINGNGNGLSGADMLALVAHITGLLSEMEGRIMDRLTENAAGAADRWRKHDEMAAEKERRVNARFEIVEGDLLTVSKCLEAHLKEVERDQITIDARVQPVKTLGVLIARNWKTIALAILALAGILGWAGLETHIFGQ